ncbi:MAG: hypothetical protein Q4F74_02770 [Synergistaceae bacterium]|nr:hypothetical protein [Synergistaceae bacterium]
MPFVTRINDDTIGVCNPGFDCCAHTRHGRNSEGSPLFEVEGQLVQLVGHSGPCNCPHGGTYESIEGSRLIEVEDIPVTLIGHTTVCRDCGQEGHHITGSALMDVAF